MRKSADNHKATHPGPHEFALGDELRGQRATLGKSLLDVQRDLRIKAAYIAAIENGEAEVFPNPAFIPGYVRSYARYLNLDPDAVYARFRQESGFGRAQGGKGGPVPAAQAEPHPGGFRPNFPMAEVKSGWLLAIPFSAIGSLLVLIFLVAGLGYGGWTVLQNIQRVEFAPVDELPQAVAEMEALPAPVAEPAGQTPPELASPVAATALVDLYRAQEAEVPILVPRDGPIAAIDPDEAGPLATETADATPSPETSAVATADAAAGLPPAVGGGPGTRDDAAAAPAKPRVTVLAERAAWIRVYLEDGTIIFERILERGEVYDVPTEIGPLLIWAGNSGSVYVRVDESLHGPLGKGTRAVRNVLLEPKALAERYAVVEEIPEVISETISSLAQRQTEAVVIQSRRDIPEG